MRIRRFQEIGLEPAGQAGIPQWSILGPSCAHSINSIPDCRPIIIRSSNLTRDHPEFRGVYKPSQTSHLYQGYPEEGPYFRPPRRQPDRRLPRCFLCGEEGHFVSHCLAHSVLQRLLRQQAHDNARVPPRGQVLELPPTEDGDQKLPSCTFKLLRGSPEVKVTPVGCAVGPPITGQLTLEGIQSSALSTLALL